MLDPESLPGRQPLLGHDLQKFEGGRIPERPIPGQHVMDLANSGRPFFPEHSKDGELGVSRLAEGRRHAADDTYDVFRTSTKIFVATVRESAAVFLQARQ